MRQWTIPMPRIERYETFEKCINAGKTILKEENTVALKEMPGEE